jgi:hypothetical protein
MDFTRDELARWTDTHQTSDELAQAILEHAKDEDHAHALWMADDTKLWEQHDEDSTQVWQKIMGRAWALVDKSDEPDREFLRCGEGKYYRT